MRSLAGALLLMFMASLAGVAIGAGTPHAEAAPAPSASFNDISPTRDVNEMRLVIRVLKPGELRPTCRPIGAYEGKPACADFDATSNTCTVYTFPPQDAYDKWAFEAIGHYIWHCHAGAFHKD